MQTTLYETPHPKIEKVIKYFQNERFIYQLVKIFKPPHGFFFHILFLTRKMTRKHTSLYSIPIIYRYTTEKNGCITLVGLRDIDLQK